MPANTGPSKPKAMFLRKLRKRRPFAASRCHRTSSDLTNQVIVYFEPGGSGKYEVIGGRTPGHNGGSDKGSTAGQNSVGRAVEPPVDANRKGRPKGSKNKSPPSSSSSSSAATSSGSVAFNYRCEKKSLTYTFAGPVKCKSCDRTFNGDPVAHCLEHHKTVCPICGRTYRPPLSMHIKSHGTRHVSLTVSCYECYACKEKFGNESTMAEHVRSAHRVTTTAECPLCGITGFETVDTAVDHLVEVHCPQKTFSHPTVYRCRVCLAGFKSQINVLRHACNKIKSPQCAECGKTFPSKMRYAFHLQFHEHPKWPTMHLHCDLCLAEFEDEYQLYDHIRFRHELHDKAVCEVCGRTFKSSMGLNIHRRYHNGSRDFACNSCNKSFLNKSTLREHEISHMEVKPFQCHICGQYLSRASRLRSHVKTHRAAESTEQTCYGCAKCGYVAPNPAAVADHTSKEHFGDDVLSTAVAEEYRCYAVRLSSVVKCEYCDSTYLDAVHLNRHRDAAHAGGGAVDGDEAFICVVCSSTFSTYSRLTTHKLTHGINMESSCAASVKPDRFEIPQFFSCEYCAKMCLHYTYFCLHRRLKHPPDVQTHVCEHCAMEFKTSWRLTYHRKIAHGQSAAAADEDEKPAEMFNCTMCSRQFVKIGALNLHKTRTHIDVVGDVCKYLCHQCGKFFSSEFSLKSHVKTHGFVVGDGGGADDRENKSFVDFDETASQTRPNNRRRTYRKSTANATARPATAVKQSCPYCAQTTEDKATFIEHVNGHLRNCKPVLPAGTVCELCDARFGDSTILKYHLDDHVKMNQAILCRACYLPFLSKATHDAHVASTCEFATMPVNAFVDSAAADAQPDVKFVGVSDASQADVLPLIVDCSDIFGKFTTTVTSSSAVDLKSVELQSVKMQSVEMQSAELQSVKMQSAELQSVKIQSAEMQSAEMQSAELQSIELQSAELQFAEQQSTKLQYVEMQSVELQSAEQQSTELQSVEMQSTELQSAEQQSTFKEPSADGKFMESSVMDELLSIISTPRSSAALDTIDFQQSDYMSLEEIFNSISSLG
ncbi:zinc finger protein 91-like [Aphis craccivora]|uniref:Zinc finger protein 91-like n=1 Tax=Aphis craccivora TaxID=307492 RepID=A0A6G0ZNH7_APHCR|nr:zinc finger protein 91-like [Aphis craccivora]